MKAMLCDIKDMLFILTFMLQLRKTRCKSSRSKLAGGTFYFFGPETEFVKAT